MTKRRRTNADQVEEDVAAAPRSPKRQRQPAALNVASGAGAGAGAGAAAGSSTPTASPASSPSSTAPPMSPGVPQILGPIPAPVGSAEECLESDKFVHFAGEEETARQRVLQKEIIRRRADKPIRIYADGIFDMFHYGHARALEQAKKLFPNVYLMVGCCNDELTHSLKGRTVMRDVERYEGLRGCKWVDEVVKDAPWVITQKFIDDHDIDFVCHDAEPYAGAGASADSHDIYEFVKKQGRFLGTRRTGGVSTTGIIVRIIHDYDKFVRRNLKRGLTGKEMNVPYIKEKAIQIDMAFDKAKHKVEEAFEEVAEGAKEVQTAFISLFSKKGALRTTIRRTRRGIATRLTELARDSLM